MIEVPRNAALLLIDVQQAWDDPYWGARNNPQAEANIVRLLTAWRTNGRPVYHVQHMSTEPNSPLRPDRPGNAIRPTAQPLASEPLFQKKVNSAFIGTGLETRLRADGITALVIVGLTTDHCVSTTTRMAGNLGFETFVVTDATATHDRRGADGQRYPAELVHQVALASLNGEFATLLTTADLLDLAP
jgi:nicotinamidase-related amidase